MQKCETCEYEKVCEIPDFVRNDLKSCKTYKEKKVKTNADIIRSMSDSELSWFLCGVFDNGSAKFICGETIPHYDEDKIMDWLKSPTTD